MNELIDRKNAPAIKKIHNLFFDGQKTRKDILDIESWIKSMPSSFDECPYPLCHYIDDGIYTREMHMKAVHLLCSKIHKDTYFVSMLSGRIWLVNEFESKELIGPCSFHINAGAKNILFILEDTVWIDTHSIVSDNIEDAEKEIFVESYQELDEYNNIIKTEFIKMCDDVNLTEKELTERSSIDIDIIDQPKKDKVEIKESKIHGLGLFALDSFKKDNIIALARTGLHRTPAGRYANHSDNPNAVGSIVNGVGVYVATKNIKNGDEILVNYREILGKAKILDEVLLCLDG